MKKIRVIISGGGTGGHIFPALSIGQALRAANPESEIIYVGAQGRMEMEKVPAAGFEIVGLPIAGLQRSLTLSNLSLPYKILKSLSMASKLIKEFKPDVVIGVGGYASAPLLFAATRKGVPALIQEQNGFAGLANRVIGKKAQKICTAYEGMEAFFPKERIVLTGNPIRANIVPATAESKAEGIAFYGLNPERKQVLITGGSLGCRTLNEAMMQWISEGCQGGQNVEILWQCGKYYKPTVDAFMAQADPQAIKHIHHTDFIARMDLAYSAADVVVARSGASTISELCVAKKATIFVPSPNVTNDHQTHNAMALVNKNAALLVKDAAAREKLLPAILELVASPEKIAELEENIGLLARPNATQDIVTEIYKLV